LINYAMLSRRAVRPMKTFDLAELSRRDWLQTAGREPNHGSGLDSCQKMFLAGKIFFGVSADASPTLIECPPMSRCTRGTSLQVWYRRGEIVRFAPFWESNHVSTTRMRSHGIFWRDCVPGDLLMCI